MRALDLLRAAEVEFDSYVDLTSGSFDIAPLLRPATETDSQAAVRSSLRVFAASAEAAPAYGPLLSTVRVDWNQTDAALILLRESVDRVSVPELLDWSSSIDAEVSAASSLAYRWFRTGLVIRPASGVSTPLRNEMVVRRELQRVLGLRLRVAERRSVRLQRAMSVEIRERSAQIRLAQDAERRAANSHSQLERVEADNVALRAALELLTEELDAARMVGESTSYRLGKVITSSMKPGRATLRAPRELRDLWRDRGAWKTTTPRKSVSFHVPAPSTVHPDSRLSWAFRDDDQLPEPASAVALVSARSTAEAVGLWGNARVLWPNDASAVFSGDEFGVLIVESGAGAAGQPWFGLAQPVAPYLDREIRGLVEAARRRKIPTLFWWTTEPSLAPRLRELADLFDHQLVAPGFSSVASAMVLPLPIDFSLLDPARGAGSRGVVTFDTSGAEAVHEVLGADSGVNIGQFASGVGWRDDPSLRSALATSACLVAPIERGAAGMSALDVAVLGLASGLRTFVGPNGADPEVDKYCAARSRTIDLQDASPLPDSDRRRCVIAGLSLAWRRLAWPREIAELLSTIGVAETAWSEMTQFSIQVDRSAPEDPSRLVSALAKLDSLPAAVYLPDTALRSDYEELESLGVTLHSDRPAGGLVLTDSTIVSYPASVIDAVLAWLSRGDEVGVSDSEGSILGFRAGCTDRQRAIWWLEEAT